MQIRGTYDVLLVRLTLPRALVADLLPPGVDLAPASSRSPDGDGAGAGVLLQLGYQYSSGPGMCPAFLRPTFHEAKLEVLDVLHPLAPSPAPALVFKQMIMFASRLMAASSTYIAGLRSRKALITPARAPDSDAETVLYNVREHVEAACTRPRSPTSASRSALHHLLTETQRPWFGWSTASATTTQFKFDTDKMHFEPVAYEAHVRINTESFIDPSVTQPAPGHGWLEFDSVPAWRVKMDYVSTDASVTRPRDK